MTASHVVRVNPIGLPTRVPLGNVVSVLFIRRGGRVLSPPRACTRESRGEARAARRRREEESELASLSLSLSLSLETRRASPNCVCVPPHTRW